MWHAAVGTTDDNLWQASQLWSCECFSQRCWHPRIRLLELKGESMESMSLFPFCILGWRNLRQQNGNHIAMPEELAGLFQSAAKGFNVQLLRPWFDDRFHRFAADADCTAATVQFVESLSRLAQRSYFFAVCTDFALCEELGKIKIIKSCQNQILE